jgi:60 kDa SS-A/Ro ribonucleoprotein
MKTHQTQVIPGRENDMVKNNAGGQSFKLDPWGRLNRFLILGSDTNTYYTNAGDLTRENATNIINLIKEDGVRVVDLIVDISTAGRAYKNDPALFALALVFAEGDVEAKTAARYALPAVARTGTHLFSFVEMANSLRGWGSALKKAVASWYQEKDAKNLAYQVTKYQSRRI